MDIVSSMGSLQFSQEYQLNYYVEQLTVVQELGRAELCSFLTVLLDLQSFYIVFLQLYNLDEY